MTTASPFNSPFKTFHADATLGEVDGWNMPLHYGDALAEHAQCRDSGAIFDLSHLGRLRLSGHHACTLLETALTRKVTDMPPRTCREAVVCNPQGGIIDVVSVYRYEDQWLLVTNAAGRHPVHAHLSALIQANDFSVKLVDETQKTAMLSVQGPKVTAKIGAFSREIPTLKPWTFTLKNLLVFKMTVSRTGFTGGDGVEIMLGVNAAAMAIKLLLKDKSQDATIKPAGLHARETLRIEAGLPALGHELTADIDPLSVGLSHAINLDKHRDDSDVPVPRFIGQDALEKIAASGPPKRLIRMALEAPVQSGTTLSVNGQPAGNITSVATLPSGNVIALALVQASTPQDNKMTLCANTKAGPIAGQMLSPRLS
ncbi:MAG: aminomethyltransferase family protein [Algisphaera sp.]